MRRVREGGEQSPVEDAPRVGPQELARRVEHPRWPGRLLNRWGLSSEREIARFLPLLLLGVVMSVAAALLLRVTHGQSLFADEWVFFSYRSHGSAETLFAPHNGSFDLVSLLVYRTVFLLFGPDITVLRLILVALELLCAGLVFELTRRRVGDVIALGATTLLLFLGSGWLLVSTVGISLYLAVALGLAALIAIQRGDLRGDVVACVSLVLAVASYSAALPFAAGAVMAIALRPAPQRWWRTWVVAIPLLLYGAWRLWAAHYTEDPTLPFIAETVIAPGAISKAPGLVWQAFAAGLASATGLFRIGTRQPFVVDHSWGEPLAVLFVAAALTRFLWPRRPPLDRSLWIFLAMPLVYWTALSLVSLQATGTKIPLARSPTIAGYQYTNVVLLLLAAAALASGIRIPRLAHFALAAALLASLAPNLLTLRQAAHAFRVNGPIDRAELAAVELVGSRAGRIPIETRRTTPDFTYDLPIPAQDYLAASKRVGSAAAAASSLTTTTPKARRAADLTLIRLYRLALRPSGGIAPPIAGPKAPAFENQAAGFAQSKRGCVSVWPRRSGTPLSFILPRGELSVQADEGPPVAVNMRRFTDPPGLPAGSVAGGASARLRIPVDASRQPWRLLISPAQAIRVCALPDTAPPGKRDPA